MNRRRFLQGILQSALVVAFLPQIEPLIKLIPPLHRKLTSFDWFESLLKKYMVPAIVELQSREDPIWDVIKPKPRFVSGAFRAFYSLEGK